ncbi:MAG TPA: cache domain-containing protein [Tenuifilaceae bacterium]|nr:cache domain-containing protein [Bacteroidales bacterium]MDI9516529.1 cache domain-containing protein [Bacteroidota bacterium]OQC61853.1 MAG: Methyl-accepting chemotaxis protein PctA [Bacteroidetes bacterium ADurb.Bin008]HNV80563.1 cache domain-containing protein [Tenuifilaceae bacterium]MZP81174.1 GAF domain-containing protein [Bacteroidales bacterium]
MKVKLKIRQKILIYILSLFTVLYLFSLGYIVYKSRETIIKETKQNSVLVAQNAAGNIRHFFEKNLTITRTLSKAFTVYRELPPKQWQDLFLKMYMPVIKANPNVYIVWDSWEYYGFVPGYTKGYGRILQSVVREGSKFTISVEERSMDGDPERYGNFKQNNVDAIWEPYPDQVQEDIREPRLMTTIASPIQIEGKFMGLIGLDVELTYLQELVKSIKLPEGGYAFLLSSDGVIAGHPDGSLIFKNVSEILPDEVGLHNILQRVQKGENFEFSRYNGKDEHLMLFTPIRLDGVHSVWSLVISIPKGMLMSEANRTLLISLGVGILGLILIYIVLVFVSDGLTRPIVKITGSLKRMAAGEISGNLTLDINSGDEIEEMSKALNTTIEGLNQKTAFALDIGQGKLASQLEMLGENDILGKSLLDMRDSLQHANAEEEKRKVEDSKRAWANEGFALFSDILRQNSNSIDNLADEVVRNLVKYFSVNQAGMFIINDDDKNDVFFQYMAAYAWDRKKYVTKRIELGEGLVGACAMEKETIQLTEIPEDYVFITSGLGKATPRYVILVPLKHEDTVVGVLELASFSVMASHEVELLEKVGESIASSILSVKINTKTRMLLEQSQQQAEEMKAQEEEMRQNMEELLATQEEMGRKAEEQKRKEDDLINTYEAKIEDLKNQIIQLKSKGV